MQSTLLVAVATENLPLIGIMFTVYGLFWLAAEILDRKTNTKAVSPVHAQKRYKREEVA